MSGRPDADAGSARCANAAARLGAASAALVVALSAVYAAVLAMGLLSLSAPDEPIGDPWFTLLEVLILVLAPCLVTMMAALHACADRAVRVYSLAAVVFMALVAGVTASVHIVILTVVRGADAAATPWLTSMFSFRWPSVAYALDVLAWDVFFPLAALCAVPVFRGGGLARGLRWLLVVSALLALAGLSGVVLGDMRFRNIGIVGYAVAFPAAAALLCVWFLRRDGTA